MKALVINTITVAVCNIYWVLIGILYMVAAQMVHVESTYKLILFFLAGKGLTDLVIWIVITNVTYSYVKKSEHLLEQSSPDLNTSLRHEILHFATSGIRHCAANSAESTPNQTRLKVKLYNDNVDKKGKVSLWFFLRLIIGQKAEINQLAELGYKQRKAPPPQCSVRIVTSTREFKDEINSKSTRGSINGFFEKFR
jgi:hypothetical protein